MQNTMIVEGTGDHAKLCLKFDSMMQNCEGLKFGQFGFVICRISTITSVLKD